MNSSFLAGTGVRVSSLCMGTMSFGGEADEATSAQMFEAARAAGINIFDCADVYAGGRSEEILGGLIKGCRDEVVITTKAYFPTSKDANARGASRFHLVRAVDASLRRLNTDYIDLFFLHRFDDRTDLHETMRALDDLVRQGKILYLGASNFAAWQVMKAQGIAAREGLSPFVCIQPMYNLVKRQAEVELLPMCQSENIGALTYSPMGGGLLSGKYSTSEKPEDGRLVVNKMYTTRYGDQAYFEAAQRFTALAREHGHHPAALAIAFCGRHPGVTAPIIGARNLEQLKVPLSAGELKIDDALYEKISAIWPAPPPATDRNEERTAHNYGSR